MVSDTDFGSITFRSDVAISIDRKELVIPAPRITAHKYINSLFGMEDNHYYPEKDLYKKIYKELSKIKNSILQKEDKEEMIKNHFKIIPISFLKK
jgi:hypothetical protein